MSTPNPLNVAIIDYNDRARTIHIPLIRSVPSLHLSGIVLSPLSNPSLPPPVDITIYPSPQSVLTDPSISAIVLTSPLSSHRATLTTQCLQADKHVLVPPPLASTSAEVDSLIALSNQKNKILCPLFLHRYDGDYNTIAKLKLPKYGQPLGEWKLWESNAVGYDDDEVKETAMHLLDQIHHHFFFFGNGKIAKIVRGETDVDGQDGEIKGMSVEMEFEGGKRKAIVNVGTRRSPRGEDVKYYLEGVHGSYSKRHPDPQSPQLKSGMPPTDPQFGIEPQEHHGTLTLTNTNTNKPGEPKPYPTIKTPTWKGLYSDFGAAIRGERDVPNAPEDARNCQIILEAALKSAREGSQAIDL